MIKIVVISEAEGVGLVGIFFDCIAFFRLPFGLPTLAALQVLLGLPIAFTTGVDLDPVDSLIETPDLFLVGGLFLPLFFTVAVPVAPVVGGATTGVGVAFGIVLGAIVMAGPLDDWKLLLPAKF